MTVADAWGSEPGGLQLAVCCRQHGEHAVEHRDVKVLPESARPCTQQGGTDSPGGEQPGDQVSERLTQPCRPGFLRTGDAHDSRKSLDYKVVGGGSGHGPVLSETGDGRVHDARIASPRSLVVDSQALGDSRAKVFDDDVGGLDEREQRLTVLVVLEVECHRTLATIEHVEVDALAVAERAEVPRV